MLCVSWHKKIHANEADKNGNRKEKINVNKFFILESEIY